MAREALLWKWMHERGRVLPMLDMRRVENTLTRGTPDVDLNYWGHQAWVELKGCDSPARATSQLVYELHPLQSMWLRRRWAVGGMSWLYFRVGLGMHVRRYLVAGCRAEELEKPVPEGTLAGMSLLPPGHDFEALLHRVCRRDDFPSDTRGCPFAP